MPRGWLSPLLLLASSAHAQTLSRLVSRVFDSLYHTKVASLLSSDTQSPIRDDGFLRDIQIAAQLSNDVYSNIPDSIVIARDSANKPECVVKQVDGDLWIVVRGTMTAMDLVRDASWMVKSNFNEAIDLPAGVQLQANAMTALINRAISTTLKYRKYNRICITGHSLGGSICTAIYLNLKLKLKTSTNLRVYTFGTPYSVAQKNGPNTRNAALEDEVFNIVYQLDVIPRLVGATKRPDYLFLSKMYNVNNDMLYSAFGKYYVLYKSGSLALVRNVSEFMSIFPDNELDFVYSLLNDHSMGKVVTAMARR